MTESTINEIKALISLLDDPDTDIINAVRKKIFQLGVMAVPELEKAWENSLNQATQTMLEEMIYEIQFQNIENELSEWVKKPDDCLMGATIVAHFQYPEFKYEAVENVINRITEDLWVEINDRLTPIEKIRVLNHIFFEINQFAPNFNNFYAAQNYFINQIIETKKGNPISLAIIYAAVAQKAGLPVYGVNLPKNFILAFKDFSALSNDDSILFYINPYNKGSILGKREIDYFLKQQKIVARDEYYQPCTNIEIVERLINNLINSFESEGQPEKTKRLKHLLGILKKG